MTTAAIDFAKLKEYDEELCIRICGFLNLDDEGVHDVDLSQLKPETRIRVENFLQPEEFRIDPNEPANRQRLADEEAALVRLQQYVDERGLLPLPENAQAVKTWLDANLRGY